jgi:F0F1-type ATP synthase assembly protein I
VSSDPGWRGELGSQRSTTGIRARGVTANEQIDPEQRDGARLERAGGAPVDLKPYAGMGLELAGAVVGLTLLGYWADLHWGTAPRYVITGAAIGIIGGGYNFIRQALALSQEAERQRREQREHDRGSDQRRPRDGR